MFVDSRPDYLPVTYSSQSFRAALQKLDELPVNKILCLDGYGFKSVGKIQALFENIKEYLGFTDQTNTTRVSARLIQLMFQGAACGFIDENEIHFKSFKSKILNNHLKVDPVVKKVFENINQPDLIKNELVKFYDDNQKTLNPTFWNRIVAKKVSTPIDFQFGEVHLVLAEDQMFCDPDQAALNFSQAAQSYNSHDLNYTNRLIKSFHIFASQAYSPNINKGAIYLKLAERKCQNGDFVVGYEFFNLAKSLNTSFNQCQKIQFLQSAVSVKKFDAAEKLVETISLENMDEALKKSYADSMITLGDHYFSKSETLTTLTHQILTLGMTPSSKDHCIKALNYYRRAYYAIHNRNQLIFNKILEVVKNFSEEDLLNFQTTPNQWDEISCLLILMKKDDLLESSLRREAITKFSNKIFEVYNLKQFSEQDCLYFIEEALKCIGPIESRLFYSSKYFFGPQSSINTNVPGLLNDQGKFKFDVGAGLYFLKGEILRCQKGDTSEVLETYKYAAHLALQNPFGAASIFLKDDQPTFEGHIGANIESYRTLAIQWGAKSSIL